jgi:hypothetical protein
MYKNSSNGIYKLVLKVFLSHLWYLNDTLIGLAFFDSRIPDNIKAQMVTALDKIGTDYPEQRLKLLVRCILTSELHDFVTNNTYKLCTAHNIKTDFLMTFPNAWINNIEYIDGCEKIKKLKVVNDATERGIVLMTYFNGTHTNQEDQQQYLLQVVENTNKIFRKPKNRLY